MRKHLFDLVMLAIFSTIAVTLIVALRPDARNVALHIYVVVLGGLVMLAVIAAAGDAVPRRQRSLFDAALSERTVEIARVHGLERMEREVTLASASSFDLHFRLIPHLREIAGARLERAGRAPSEETLGEWWDLLRPDRPLPTDRFAPGISPGDLRDLVADLEELH